MKKNKKNGEIMLVTYLFVGLFLGMIGYIVYFTATHEEELINNSYNPRQQMLTEQNTRGTIYAAGGEVLAETVKDKDKTETRQYPYGKLFAHAVGYSTYGKTGIEAQGNYYLINSDIPFAKKAENERRERKNPGNNVYTTLDVDLQEIADKALGAYKGAIIAMNPKTGEILAMVSKPDFDPNTVKEDWEELAEDEESGVLVNRISQGLYPPGSTLKIVTALEYIRENPESYEAYRYECSGSFVKGEEKINCYHGIKHGSVNLKKSFAKSCNSSFANMAVTLDKAAYGNTLDKLYFNKELPVDFLYNKSSLMVDKDTEEGELIQSAIGQGKTQMTPLHMAMITSAIANRGVMMTPRLVESIQSADGAVVKEYKPQSMGNVMTAKEAQILTEFMEETVLSGTATKLSGENYTAAGKTGSAEYNGVKEDSHAWFTGFAPAEDPELAVTVIIEGAGSGGDYAVPVAKKVFSGYLFQNLRNGER